MTKAITISYKILHHYREKLFAVLAIGIFITGAAYVFLLQKAIVNVVDREHLVQTVSEKSTDVGDLEAQYFTLKNSVTLDLAHAKGFKDADVTAYISKKAVTAMASNNEF